ncbi:MAG TPA: hypothetical protein VJ908_06895 [Wenzhouxiangellaceae bacterium]|nr:hypothetical protein [Wenzhouxiangellaceae bacterium]
MTRFTPFVAVALASVLLGACSDDAGDASESNILETQQQALERARGVEQDMAEAARRQAEQIERAEGDG